MTGVRFYICPETEWSEAAKFAARLARQLKRRGHRILFLTESIERQKALSDWLWQYPADAFLPHRIEPTQPESGIDIAAGQEWDDHHDVLINLTDQVPPNYARFEHLCEVVPSSDTLLANARTRWIHYKDRGHPLKRIETDNI